MKIRMPLLTSAVALACSPLTHAQVQELDFTVVEGDSIDRDAVVEVLTADDLNARQVDDFEELVRLVPGVSVSKGDDRWGASGFSIRGLDEDRVAMNVDGVPQAETLKYETGQAYGYFKGSRNGVDIEALKVVEIVKGADAILSGNGALAGAVNMTTKDADDYLAASGNDSGFGFKAGHRTVNDEYMASIAAANRTGAFESLLIYTRRDGHEFESYDMGGADIPGSEREIPDPMDTEQNSLLLKVGYGIAEGHEIRLVGSYYDRDVFTDAQSFNAGFYSDRVGNDINRTTRIGIEHDLVLETALFDSVSTTLNHQEVKVEANTTQYAFFDFGPFLRADEDRTDTRSFDQELLFLTVDLVKEFDTGGMTHGLAYGLELQDKEFENVQMRSANSNLNDLGWVTTNIGSLLPHAEAEVMTLYALDTFALGDSTRLRLGGRYDDYTYDANSDENYEDDTGTLREVSFNTFTWTVGVEQDLTENLSIEAGVSTGFRAPTIEDMYSTSGSVDDWGTVANPDLESESGQNLDVAVSGNFSAGYFRLGAFFSRYDDFIDYRPRSGINTNTGLEDPNGWQEPVNYSEVDMKGVEFEGSLDLNEAFGFMPGLGTSVLAAYTQGEQSNGDPVYSVQPLNLIWTLSYNDPNGRWGVNSFVSYTAGKDNNDSYQTDDAGVRTYPLYLSNTATIIDLVAYVDFTDNLRLTAGVYNLTDKEYYNWDSVRFVDQGDLRPGIGVTGDGIKRYSEPGRNFEVGVNYGF